MTRIDAEKPCSVSNLHTIRVGPFGSDAGRDLLPAFLRKNAALAALPPKNRGSPEATQAGELASLGQLETQSSAKRKRGYRSRVSRDVCESPATDHTQIPKPACLRCRSKKIKCDALVPKCTGCAKSGSDCRLSSMTADDRQFDREYLESLHASAKKLEAQHEELSRQILSAKASKIGSDRRPKEAVPSIEANNATQAPVTVHSHRDGIHGTKLKHHEGGLGFLRVVLSSIRQKDWDNCFHDHHASSKLTNGYSRTRGEASLDQTAGGQIIPPQLGTELTAIFLKKAYIKHPFMARSAIQNTTQAVLASYSGPQAVSDQEHFRAFMIFAIGAVYRNQELRHAEADAEQPQYVDPYHLYATALSRGKSLNFLCGVDAVTNLLLIARFGFFCVTGISLWDISFLCLRVAIESGLHRKPTNQLPAIQEQIQRRVFWQCYNLDRHSSTTLGRPFGVPDARITVSLPVNIDDEVLQNSFESLDAIETLLPNYQITEISTFCALTKLRTICSRMVTDFKRLKRKLERKQQSAMNSDPTYSPDFEFAKISLPGQIWQLYDNYMRELLHWRIEFPEGPTAISSHYHDTRWLDLHFLQEKLLLSRHALDLMPLADPSSESPPNQLIDDFYNATKDIIILYSELSAEAAIEPAQGRFYRVFIAGLSMLYVIIIERKKAVAGRSGPPANSGSDTTNDWVSSRQHLLKQCRETMDRMSKFLVDRQMAVRYLAVYDVLCREIFKHTSHLPTSCGPMSRGDPVHTGLPHDHGHPGHTSIEPENDLGIPESFSADSHAAAMALSHLAVEGNHLRPLPTDQPLMLQNQWASADLSQLHASTDHITSAGELVSMSSMFTPGNLGSIEPNTLTATGFDIEDTFGWTSLPLVEGYSPGIYAGYDQNPGMLLSDWEGIFNVLVNE